jgi:threonyl-tRNA synthetase
LDFNLPERFNLQFRASEDTEEVAREKLILSKAQSEIAEKIIEGKRLASDEIKEPIDAAEEE